MIFTSTREKRAGMILFKAKFLSLTIFPFPSDPALGLLNADASAHVFESHCGQLFLLFV
jgi:membrane protein YqaA with SNARE-associated domain